MQLSDDPTGIPVTRSACVCRFAGPLYSVGVPVEQLLNEAGIPARIIEYPESFVPLRSAFRFVELACHSLGTEHLPIQLGMEMSLRDYGSFGELLLESTTAYEYLCNGIKLYNTIVTGQRFWLSRHGREFRFNLTTDFEPDLGSYQAHLDSLLLTIAVLRKAVLPCWSPREISLAWQARQNLPEYEILEGSRIVRNAGITYLTIPESVMAMRFDGGRLRWQDTPRSQERNAMPNTLDRMVEQQISALLSSCELNIDTVAESLTLNRRSLQRALDNQGLTYSLLLARVRGRLAAQWLQETEKPIAEISLELGYSDAANFTRAFRKKTGISPNDYRRTSVAPSGYAH